MTDLYNILLSPIVIILVLIISLFIIFKSKIEYMLIGRLLFMVHKYQKQRRPKRIILVRHGKSIANNNYDILQKVPDNKIKLSELGVEQAKEAGKKLKEIIGNESIQFYVSPYKRTKQTYEYILESLKDNHSNVIIKSDLREQEYGNLQSEMDRQFKEQEEVGVYYYRFKNGESGADVSCRMSIFLQYLFRRILSIDYYSWDNIIVISHALTLKFFMMNFLNLPVSKFEQMKQLDNCKFWILEKNSNGKYHVKDDIFFPRKDSE